MRLRLDGAKLNKARRGALYFVPASGYEWDPLTARFRFDPDEQVQRAIHLVFEHFGVNGSAYAVARYFRRHGLPLPARGPHPGAALGPGPADVDWRHPPQPHLYRRLCLRPPRGTLGPRGWAAAPATEENAPPGGLAHLPAPPTPGVH
jgi:hypothetical protein